MDLELTDKIAIVTGASKGIGFAITRALAEERGLGSLARLQNDDSSNRSTAIREILEQEGIAVRTSAACIRPASHPDGVAVGVDCHDGDPEVVAIARMTRRGSMIHAPVRLGA